VTVPVSGAPWKRTDTKEHLMADPSPIDIQKALGGMNYPASKEDLVKHAQDKGADDTVLETLNNLPDREFDSPTDVNKEASK
jgi:hypothetical protein